MIESQGRQLSKDKVAADITGLIMRTMPAENELNKASLHLIRAGGKRLRPFIATRFYEMFDADYEGILPVAASIELIHNFTLVHDDIMDRDDFRHNVPTVHRVYGEPLAILAGDMLFARAFKALSLSPILKRYPERYMMVADLLAEQSIAVCEGQSLDMAKTKDFFNQEHYMELIRKKTSALFIAASGIGVLSAGKYEYLSAAKKYGEALGLAFQIIDDLLGIIGETKATGKPVGDDIREGKKTLPIFIAYNMADRELKEAIMAAYRRENSQGQIELLVQRIREIGIEDKVKEMASEYAEKASEALSSFPKCKSRDELEDLARLVVKRSS